MRPSSQSLLLTNGRPRVCDNVAAGESKFAGVFESKERTGKGRVWALVAFVFATVAGTAGWH
jgi:hypothetical protein